MCLTFDQTPFAYMITDDNHSDVFGHVYHRESLAIDDENEFIRLYRDSISAIANGIPPEAREKMQMLLENLGNSGRLVKVTVDNWQNGRFVGNRRQRNGGGEDHLFVSVALETDSRILITGDRGINSFSGRVELLAMSEYFRCFFNN